MLIDDNKRVSFNVCGCPNAFKSHIFLVVKSTGIFKIGKRPDSTVEPNPIPGGKIRDIADCCHTQLSADSTCLTITAKGCHLQMKSCAVIDFSRFIGDSPRNIPALGIRLVKDMIGRQPGRYPGLDGQVTQGNKKHDRKDKCIFFAENLPQTKTDTNNSSSRGPNRVSRNNRTRTGFRISGKSEAESRGESRCYHSWIRFYFTL